MITKILKNILSTPSKQHKLMLDIDTDSLNSIPFGEDMDDVTKKFTPDKKIKYGNDTELLYYNSGLCLSFTQKHAESFMIFIQESQRAKAYKRMRYNNLTLKDNNKIHILTQATETKDIHSLFGKPFEKYTSKEDNCETYIYIKKSKQLLFRFNPKGCLTITEYCLI